MRLASPVLAPSVVLCLALPAVAGSLVVTVRDDAGSPVPGQRVRVVQVPPREIRPWEVWSIPGSRPVLTDAAGRAVFDGLEPGPWAAIALVAPDGPFVETTGIPDPAASQVTLRDPGDRLPLDLRLVRGTRVRLRLATDIRDKVVARVLGIGPPLPLTNRGDSARTLAPGVRRLRLEGPEGAPAVAADVDGAPADPAEVVLDLEPGDPQTVVTWTLAATGRIEGRIASDLAPGGVVVRAVLLSPGPQPTPARTVTAPIDLPTRLYDSPIPAGTWRVQPAGPRVRAARPPWRDVSIAAGEAVRADFEVDLAPEDGGGLDVSVMPPGGVSLPLPGAWVHVFQEGHDDPVSTGWTDRDTGVHPVRGLPDGDYRVEAGHPGYARSVLHVPDFETGPEPRRLTVRLEKGGVIRVHATGQEDAVEKGVPVVLAPREPDPPPPAWDRDRFTPQEGRTDTTGWVSFPGLEPGEYEVGARPPRPDVLVRFADSRARGTRARVEKDGETVLELRIVPAAALALTPVCDDEGPLPEPIRVQVTPAEGTPREPEWIPARPSAEERRLRDGTLRIEPLDGGSFRVGLLPDRFDRWTWLPAASENPDDAIPVEVTEGETLDLGPRVMACAPRVAFAPQGGPVADYRRAGVRAVAAPLPQGEPRTLHARAFADRVELGPLPEGRARVDLLLCVTGRVSSDGARCLVEEAVVGTPVGWSQAFEVARGRVAAWTPEWPATPR